MSLCLLESDIKEPKYIKNKPLCRLVSPKKILIHLNKNKLYDIICYLMSGGLNLNAYGYNKIENNFWGKKMKNKLCVLEFNLEIVELDNTCSYIIITPIIGTNQEFDKFIENFYNCIYIYNKIY